MTVIRSHGRLPLVVLTLLLAAVVPASVSMAQPERLVLALYYPWYGSDSWGDPALSDTPEIPYEGADPEVIARHVGWARDAGIDVLVSAWFGPTGGNPTETAFSALLDAAAARGTRAAIMLETDDPNFFGSYEAQRDALAYALAVHAPHPAYLRHEGRPVIFVWRPRGIWTGAQRANRDGPAAASSWQALRDEVDPERSSMWIAESEATTYLGAFDGMFFYNVAGLTDPGGVMTRLGQSVRDFAFGVGAEKLWIGTAMPGYDDTRIPGRSGRFAVDRADGGFFRRTFDAAAASRPDWIMIVSFNEWAEGSGIEPSASYGRLYLDVSGELTRGWKATSGEAF